MYARDPIQPAKLPSGRKMTPIRLHLYCISYQLLTKSILHEKPNSRELPYNTYGHLLYLFKFKVNFFADVLSGSGTEAFIPFLEISSSMVPPFTNKLLPKIEAPSVVKVFESQ
jgi:hypothetical protein